MGFGVLGADPDAPPPQEHPDEGTGNGDGFTATTVWMGNRDAWECMRYFLYHRKSEWGRRPDVEQRKALGASFNRLVGAYSVDSIKLAIDRFYSTPTAARHPKPGFAFCNKAFQEQLLEGAPIATDSAIMLWIKNGFERDNLSEDLPWGGEFDREVTMEFITDEAYNVLLRTFPDVVADVLLHWHDEDWRTIMDGACDQHMWLLGLRKERSPVVSVMKDRFYPPRDFTSIAKAVRPRATQPTVEEAVRVANG